MHRQNRKKILAARDSGWALVLVVLFPLCVYAGDDLRARADSAWAAREDRAQTMLAIELYEKCAALDPADKEVRILLAKATCWAFEQEPEMDKKEVVRLMDKGIKACNEILAVNQDDPQANYWLMWNMAGRTLARGIFSGFAFKEALVGTIMVAKTDISYEYGGVYCYWAMVINTLPGLLGKFFHFSNDDAIWLYQRAIALQPGYLRNHYFLGAAYEIGNNRKAALQEYRFCINQPENALPEAVPENRHYKRLALERLAEM